MCCLELQKVQRPYGIWGPFEGIYIPRTIFKSKYHISLNFHMDFVAAVSTAILFVIS